MRVVIFEPVRGAWQVPEARGASFVVMHPELPVPDDDFLAALAGVVVPDVAYVAFIGPGAEAVHDRFDRFVIDRRRALGIGDSATVTMTTWFECASVDAAVSQLDEGEWDSMMFLGEIVVMAAPDAESRLVEMLEHRERDERKRRKGVE
jgi:hypothetical protein